MTIKIGDTVFEHFEGVTVALSYDGVASTFKFDALFDPSNETHRRIFRPDTYAPIIIEKDGKRLITGTKMNTAFSSDSGKALVTITGYSKTGVLEDCDIPTSSYPLQSKGLTAEQIVRKIASAFDLSVIVDPDVADRVGKVYQNVTASDNESPKDFLSKILGHINVMMTHDEHGNLLLTECKSKSLPIFDFKNDTSGVSFTFGFDGQKQHSNLEMLKQATKKKPKKNKDIFSSGGSVSSATANKKREKIIVSQASIINPYCRINRPKTSRQRGGDINDTSAGVRNVLADELKALPLVITIINGTLNGTIVRPNNLITVYNPELYIFKPTKFFIESVTHSEDSDVSTAVLNCYLPEVYNNDQPINIFD